MGKANLSRSTLLQALPQAGWDCAQCRREATDRLWALMQAEHPHVNETAARHRFALLLRAARRLVDLGLPDGKKPTTWLRDQITDLLRLPEAEAVAILQEPYPVLPAGESHDADGAPPVRLLANALDLWIEAKDPSFRPDVLVRPEHLKELGRRRHAFLLQHSADLTPLVTRGPEATSATIADLVVEALVGLTGEVPRRSVRVDGPRAGQDSGWGLAFFRAVLDVIAPPALAPATHDGAAPDHGYDNAKVWRRALERVSGQGSPPSGGSSGPAVRRLLKAKLRERRPLARALRL